MQGKTHAMLGCASVLFIQTQIPTTNSFKTICISAVVGLIAAALPDIDTEKSKIHARIKSVLITSTIFTLILFIMSRIKKMSLPLSYYLEKYNIQERQLTGVLLLTIFILFGMCQTHRGFTHSILAVIFFTFSMYLITPYYYFYAFVGYISHVIADLPNKKGVQIFFPKKKKYAFYWCTSNGAADIILFYISVAVSAICVYMHFYDITHVL